MTTNYHRLTFRLNGSPYTIWAPRAVKLEELYDMLTYVRRLLGYIIYPRWSMARMFFAECLETFRKQDIFKKELKKASNEALKVLDSLEVRHAMDFDKEFIDIMTNSLSGKTLNKLNELRGAIGGALMRHGMKNYILCSYPYTFLNICFDNILEYDRCMGKVYQKYQIDFTPVFLWLRGGNMEGIATKVFRAYLKATGEPIPKGFTFKDSGCVEKLESINGILLSESNIKDSFMEAYYEMPDEKKALVKDTMAEWLTEDKEEEKEKQDMMNLLSQKYKVAAL